MLNTIKRMRGEQGFTLIELLVVILIIGILLAIALPTFLNQQNKAKDTEAKTALNTAYKVAKSEQATNSSQQFPAAASLASAIQTSEPELGTILMGSGSADVATQQKVYVLTSGTSSSNLLLGYKSASGQIFTLTVTANGAPVTAP